MQRVGVLRVFVDDVLAEFVMKRVKRVLGARNIGWLVALVTMLTFVSIAFAGGLGQVVVESTPSGARVQVGSVVVGQTPATLKLPEGSKTRIVLKKRGYKDKAVVVSPKKNKMTRVRVKLSPN